MNPPPVSPEDVERTQEIVNDLRRRAGVAESKAASRTFARLRVNVTHVTPGYVNVSVFQSHNAGTNWACAGTAVTFDEDWAAQVFGAVEVGDRFEFELVGIHRVTD